MTLCNQKQTQGFNEGGLTHTRHTTDTESKRFARMRQQAREQFICQHSIRWQCGLEQGNGLGHGTALNRRLTLQHTLHEVFRIQPNAFLICSSTSLALAGMGVPGP